MTTIALCTNEVGNYLLTADSRVSDEDVIRDMGDGKLFETDNGFAGALAGYLSTADQVIDFIEDLSAPVKSGRSLAAMVRDGVHITEGHCSILLVYTTEDAQFAGTLDVSSEHISFVPYSSAVFAGSGSAPAYGAYFALNGLGVDQSGLMHQCIEIAAVVDPSTGGQTHQKEIEKLLD